MKARPKNHLRHYEAITEQFGYSHRMPSSTKRCHWVPQAYLRNFAVDPERRKIWRFSKNHDGGEPELKPIANVAVRFHLYSPKDAITDQRDDSMEHRLSELESLLGRPIWKELSHGYVDLSDDPTRKLVSLMVAVMQFRNPAHFEIHKALHHQMVDSISKMESLPATFEHKGQTFTIDLESWPEFRDASEDDMKRAWLAGLGSVGWYAKELMAMRWVIVEADKPTFVTSDNPVTIIHPSLDFRGLSDPETMVSFPLSPTRLLCMDHLHDEPANVYYPLQDNGAAQNIMVIRNAIEHMFSSRHPDDVCRDLLDAEERLLAAGRQQTG